MSTNRGGVLSPDTVQSTGYSLGTTDRIWDKTFFKSGGTQKGFYVNIAALYISFTTFRQVHDQNVSLTRPEGSIGFLS